MTAAQLVTQYTAAESMQALATRVNTIVNNVDDVTRQLTALQVTLRAAPRDSAPANSQQALGEINTALSQLKQFKDSVLARPLPGLGYRQYPRLREEVQTVSGMISRPMMPPTAGKKPSGQANSTPKPIRRRSASTASCRITSRRSTIS